MAAARASAASAPVEYSRGVRKKAPSKVPPARGAANKKGKQGLEPEILVAYTPAGRDTMSAIESELVPKPLAAVTDHEVSSPEITVRAAVAGRETLAAILEEASPAPRAPQTTLPYGDRVSNAPGAKTPSTAPKPKAPATASATSGVEIFEMMTYVVRGVEASRLSSDALRRQFVAENLLSRLPTPSMEAVDRVDVTPWTVQGTLVVRVWCRLGAGRSRDHSEVGSPD
jgi:hypothetical protein